MALNSTLNHISTDQKALKITVSYQGGVVAGVSSVIFRIAHHGCHPHLQVAQSLDTPNILLPSISQIFAGTPVVLDSYIMGRSSNPLKLHKFNDGVLEVYMHLVTNTTVSVSGDECRYTIEGAGLDVLTSYEHVLIGTHLYKIDSSKPTLGGQVLHLTEPLKTSASTATGVHTISVNIFNASDTDNNLGNHIAALANPHIDDSCKVDLTSVMRLFVCKAVAEVAYNKEDYHKASEVLAVTKDL